MTSISGSMGASLSPPPPPPPPPVAKVRPAAQLTAGQTGTTNAAAAVTPVEQGAAAREADRLTQLQQTDYPAYIAEMRERLAPEDRANPFAYSLDHNTPIEVKRQVFAEYQSGQNAPRVEIAPMSGNNASFDERAGPNGTIRINSDLLNGNSDPRRAGQFEAFAVWGHMEEVGHWGDMRANQIMGTPGGDSRGDEGARFALTQVGDLASQANPSNFQANYGIRMPGGGTRNVTVDTVVLQALAAEKLTNGSFARENRTANGVENFGPEGHYQTTYITAAAIGVRSGMSARDADVMANRLALGSQLPDMLARYDAYSNAMAKVTTLGVNAAECVARGIPQCIGERIGSGRGTGWTREQQQHLENVYEGLHALPRDHNATVPWLNNERAETANYIRDQIAAGEYLTAGVAIHRYGDLHAHVQENGHSFSGDVGHGIAGHAPDYLYREGNHDVAQTWSKATDYQQSLARVIGDGVAAQRARHGHPLTAAERNTAVNYGVSTWRGIYNDALADGARETRTVIVNHGLQGPLGLPVGIPFLVPVRVQGATAQRVTEHYFRNEADAFISTFHQRANGTYAPLVGDQVHVGGGYNSNDNDVRSLETVMNRFKAPN